MRFSPSPRRGSNKNQSPHVDKFPEYATGSASILRRQSSHESHQSNISREKNTPTELEAEAEAEVRSKHKWGYRLPFEKKNADANNADESFKKISPYALHVNEELSPRASAWLYTSAVSIAGLSSFLVTERVMEEVMEDESDGRSSIDKLLIIFLSISFGFSFLVTLSYRHRGVRERLTEEITCIHSIEFAISLIMFGIWCVVLRYIADPFSGLNYGLTMLTKDGYDNVWNTHIWVCAWLGWGLTSYLVGSLIMASPKKMRGVWTRGFDGAPSRTLPRHSSTGSSQPTVHAGNIRNANSNPIGAEGDFDGHMNGTNRGKGENSLGYWFMLLAFSLALAVFSITLRTGDACGSVLDGTPFCKRSSLGGAVGILCALLSLGALLLFQMDRMGSFDDLDSKRKMVISRVESTLPFLSLILHSVNLGFSTSPSGPSTQMGNMFLASAMGVVLSLMLCEQMINVNVPRTRCSFSTSKTSINGEEDRKGNNLSSDSASSSSDNLMPQSRESQDLVTGYDAHSRFDGSDHYHASHATDTRTRRANGNGHFSDSSSSFDSSSSSSSSDSSSSDSSVSESRESLDLETDEATTSHDTDSTHDHALYDTRTKAMREFISMKSAQSKNSTTNKSPGSGVKASLPVLSSSINPRDDSDSLKKLEEGSSEGTNTAYSLPEPPPLYASSPSPSPSIINKANFDKSAFLPSPPLHKASDGPPPEEHPSIAVHTAGNPTGIETSTDSFDCDPHPEDRPYIAAYTVDKPRDKKRSNNPFDSDSDCDESGVELTFEPEDDISTLECSVAASGKEPDGYKSDDLYSPPTGPGGSNSALKSRSSKKLRDSSRQPASGRQGNNPPLDPVVEHSNSEMESLSAPKTSPTNDTPKKTIEEIMNRGAKGKTKIKSKSSKSKSLHSDKEYRVRHVAKSFSSHAAAVHSDSSNDGRGPPTIDLAGGDDEAVNRALVESSFYSQDFTLGESGKIYST